MLLQIWFQPLILQGRKPSLRNWNILSIFTRLLKEIETRVSVSYFITHAKFDVTVSHVGEKDLHYRQFDVFHALLMGNKGPSGGSSYPSLLVLALVAQEWPGWQWPGGDVCFYQVGNPLDKPERRSQCFCSEKAVDMSFMVRKGTWLVLWVKLCYGAWSMWHIGAGPASLTGIKYSWDGIWPHQAPELHKHSTKAREENCLPIVCFSLMILNSPRWPLLSCLDYLFFCFVLVAECDSEGAGGRQGLLGTAKAKGDCLFPGEWRAQWMVRMLFLEPDKTAFELWLPLQSKLLQVAYPL